MDGLVPGVSHRAQTTRVLGRGWSADQPKPVATRISLTDRECKAEVRKLIDFFRGEGYSKFGWEGDQQGWTPAETAIHAMRAFMNLRMPR